MADDAGLEVGHTAEEVEQLALGRNCERVPGEVAPRGRLARRHRRVRLGQKAAVPGGDLALAARQREIQFVAVRQAHLQDAE